MKKEEFEIGMEFHTSTGKWRCTDIGSRVVVAIHLDQKDPRNYNGPPYSIPEILFDEYDFDGCSPDPSDFEDKEEIFIKSKRFSEIEDAMLFVSALPYGENSAFLDRSTEKIYYQSSYADFDGSDELSEEDYDPEIHIKIPHKNDLNLGRDLVFRFVEQNIPDMYETVYQIFKKRGAYSRYKDLLDSKGVLQQWYDFENRHEQTALLKWCEENDIDFK
jgi:hypothetical protein